MSSIAEHIFPRVVWRDRAKKLWNPIQKKALKNRPEERVRLRVIEHLMQAGWSKHRISTEESIGEMADKEMRTDIICYNQDFEPKLLVECKAEHVPISEKTAEQLARYNQKVNAPYLLMTNGRSDYWYVIEDAKPKAIDREEVPALSTNEVNTLECDFKYWCDRGFAGKKASPELRTWLTKTLDGLCFPEEENAIQFLSFGQGPSDVELSHYYRIGSLSDNKRLAVTTLQTAYGGNRMIIIFNKDDENKAVLEINLGLLFDDKKGNSSLYDKSGIRTFDLGKHWNLQEKNSPEVIMEQANAIFEKHVE
ncbi:Type I restriction enzyme R protein N terminus (HSDR_N) [Fodinibius salinus]|uniref:Type I restriction enzyme R protein N terminus (HSDR_N) n=1 Tax=Fodinibius salinus TaxID=860790 RepID=A0A5D3YL82_9BACT|nr:type I restriction enzyme HsdR N-terminal domain-containing protein [Fodinibius salinus]TYP93451.1 Type I restriction enzyme R protein N terminus (HSDR_N) [Fodinibius salinus]